MYIRRWEEAQGTRNLFSLSRSLRMSLIIARQFVEYTYHYTPALDPHIDNLNPARIAES